MREFLMVLTVLFALACGGAVMQRDAHAAAALGALLGACSSGAILDSLSARKGRML